LTDLEQLLAMFDRAGIPFQRYDAPGGRISVEVSPSHPEDGLYTTSGPLTGVSWASTDYTFSRDGALVGIHMEGD
jgi:hypothetical protein